MSTLYWIGGTVGNTGTWSTAANWSTGSAPVNGDTVVVDARGAAYPIEAGLAQSAVTLAELRIVRGAPNVGTTTSYLAISATLLNINVPPDDGSNPAAALIAVNTGTNATAVSVFGSKNIGTSGLASVCWKGVEATNTLKVYGDSIVGVATHTPGDVATVATIQQLAGPQSFLRISSGVTLTTLTQTGGKCLLECAATTVNQDEGAELETRGAGAITTVYANGIAKLNSTGTITTLQVEPAGLVSFQDSTAARTVTTCNVHGGGRILADLPIIAGAGHPVTFTNGVDFIRGAKSGQGSFGGDITLSLSAV